MWIQQDFFKYSIGIILVLVIIFLAYTVAPVFAPIMWLVTAILLPILFATLLYHIFRPVVDYLQTWKVPRYMSIVILYLSMIVIGITIILLVGPKLVREISFLSNIPPEKIEAWKSNTHDIIEKLKSYVSASQLPTVENVIFNYLQKINTFLYQMIFNAISTLTSIAIALILTPFVLFYFLRDDQAFTTFILRFVPAEFQTEIKKILHDIDDTLSGFILAQLTVAGVIGFLLFCGYAIIGLPQALSLALFAMIFYVIPILGTFIAIIPAVIVGLSISFGMVCKVVLVMFVAHFFEANILTPRVMSQRLNIHPLTIILLLLAAGSLYGLLGLLLVTPTYAIVKAIIWNLYKIFHLRYAIAKSERMSDSQEH